MKNNVDQHIDQSDFAESQEVLQAPPELMSAKPSAGLMSDPNRKPKVFIISFLVLLILVLLTLAVYLGSINQPPTADVSPTPTLTPETTSSELQERLLQIQTLVDQADPTRVDVPLPVVNMELEL